MSGPWLVLVVTVVVTIAAAVVGIVDDHSDFRPMPLLAGPVTRFNAASAPPAPPVASSAAAATLLGDLRLAGASWPRNDGGKGSRLLVSLDSPRAKRCKKKDVNSKRLI